MRSKARKEIQAAKLFKLAVLISWSVGRVVFYLAAGVEYGTGARIKYLPLVLPIELLFVFIYFAWKRIRPEEKSYLAKIPAPSFWVGLAYFLLQLLFIVG